MKVVCIDNSKFDRWIEIEVGEICEAIEINFLNKIGEDEGKFWKGFHQISTKRYPEGLWLKKDFFSPLEDFREEKLRKILEDI